MSDSHCAIKEGDIETVVMLSQQIPEFINPHGAEVYYKRISNVPHSVLIAYVADKAVGFKVGYERDGYFYSWMGGVLPDHRRMGIAQALAAAQEAWAMQQGYTSVTFRTRNSHKAMLLFALQNNFDIIGVEERDLVQDFRIILRKQL